MIQIYIIIISVTVLIGIFIRRALLTKQAMQNKIKAKKEAIKNEVKKTRESEKLLKNDIRHQKRDRKPLVNCNHLLQRAELFMARKEYQEAEKLFIQVLVGDKDHIQSNKQLALLYLLTNRNRKAEAIYKKLIERNLKDPAIFTNLGLSLYNQSKYDGAIKAYALAVQIDPHRSARYINLGQVFFIMRQFNQALNNFKKALDLEPKNMDNLYLVADTYKEMEKPIEAIKYYKKILTLDPYNKDIQREITYLTSLIKKD